MSLNENKGKGLASVSFQIQFFFTLTACIHAKSNSFVPCLVGVSCCTCTMCAKAVCIITILHNYC